MVLETFSFILFANLSTSTGRINNHNYIYCYRVLANLSKRIHRSNFPLASEMVLCLTDGFESRNFDVINEYNAPKSCTLILNILDTDWETAFEFQDS